FARLGQRSRAIEYLEQSLSLSRTLKDRFGEGKVLANLSEVLGDDQRYEEAMHHGKESARIAAELHSPDIGSNSNVMIALIHLNTGDLPAARAAAEEARQYDTPTNNHFVLALLGVISLAQLDRAAARDEFTTAVAQADIML